MQLSTRLLNYTFKEMEEYISSLTQTNFGVVVMDKICTNTLVGVPLKMQLLVSCIFSVST